MRMLFHNLNGTFPLTLIVRVGGKLLCQLFFGFIWFSWYELGGFLGVEGLDRKIGVRGRGVRKGGAGVSAGWRKARGVVAAAAIKAKSVVPAAPALRSPTPSEQARRGPGPTAVRKRASDAAGLWHG